MPNSMRLVIIVLIIALFVAMLVGWAYAYWIDKKREQSETPPSQPGGDAG